MTRQVRSCQSEDSLNAVAQAMWDGDLGCVPVLGGGKVVGMITDRDIAMAAYMQGKLLKEIKVEEVMSRDVHHCGPSETIAVAEAKMRSHQVRRLPVIDAAGNLAGIVSLNDIAIEAARERQLKNPSLSLSEVGLVLSEVCQHRGPASLVAAAE